jgi:hypothetical protein
LFFVSPLLVSATSFRWITCRALHQQQQQQQQQHHPRPPLLCKILLQLLMLSRSQQPHRCLRLFLLSPLTCHCRPPNSRRKQRRVQRDSLPQSPLFQLHLLMMLRVLLLMSGCGV